MKKLTREDQSFFESLIDEIQNEVNNKRLLESFINQISSGKKREEGHSKAESYVDFLLTDVFPQCETLKKYGIKVMLSETEREHGDFYFFHIESETKIRCNGKLGISKKLGQPNMCSIERAIDYLDEQNLPYLIFKLRKVSGVFIFSVFDYYNCVKVLSYNDGPGQTMLSESKFYKNKSFKYLKTSEVVIYLCDIQDDAYRGLLESREIRNKKFQEKRKKYERK
jgi:hypothetical protein